MRRRLLVLAGLLWSVPASPARAEAEALTVLAAASLTEAMQDVSAAWAASGHPALRLSFGSSSTLARQIEQGAPADVFASADRRWMDELDRRDLLAPGTRRDLLSNSLVLIVPATQRRSVVVGPNLDLAALLGPDGRLAVGDPSHVPVGLYAAQALQHLGLWPSVASRLAPTADVRGALLLVERGETPVGIVYATDAAVSKDVAVAGVFPPDSHEPITYPFALLRGRDTTAARALMSFLAGPEARAIFVRRGFVME